ncbi:MAG: hypothetical protein AABW88_02445 [Nanoarchaeota archaeon]
MNKKGVEIALNLVIIAAISLLVLVVVAIIIFGKPVKSVQQASECATQGGMCAIKCNNADYGTQDYQSINPTVSCPNSNTDERQVCCIPLSV